MIDIIFAITRTIRSNLSRLDAHNSVAPFSLFSFRPFASPHSRDEDRAHQPEVQIPSLNLPIRFYRTTVSACGGWACVACSRDWDVRGYKEDEYARRCYDKHRAPGELSALTCTKCVSVTRARASGKETGRMPSMGIAVAGSIHHNAPA